MCGIAGYFLKEKVEHNTDTILRMLHEQKHRGPDDSGVLGVNVDKNIFESKSVDSPVSFISEPNLIFGFNRLSILDLSSAGHQPMVNKAKKVALMLNGEIYNAFDYKSELIDKGYVFEGSSDTEIVLCLYLEYGIRGMLDRLNGMFAIAIYDGVNKNIYLIRDRVGIKPLYLLNEGGIIAFASEMKSFKALPNFRFTLDEIRLSEFLLFRNTINNTLFKNIVNITPGTYCTINDNGEIRLSKYFDIREEPEGIRCANGSDLEVALRASIKRQMISDVKLGCQLSGGVDSSIVSAFAAETLPKGSLEVVSVVFDESNYTEKEYIDKVSAKYSLISHQFKLNTSQYLDLLDDAVWHFEQPLNHPNTIGIKLLSKEAKKHVTVLLSGEGADEILAGYGRFLPNAVSFFSINTIRKVFKNRTRFLEFIFIWSQNDKRYILQTAFGNFAMANILYPKFSAELAMESRMGIWNSIADSFTNKKRKYELLTYLPDLLMRQDKMSMAHSIENRVPFLDNEMLKVALAVNEDDLIKKRNKVWEGKNLLKELCSRNFGDTFAYRKKMGFAIPLKQIFSSTSFQNRWNDELLPRIKSRGIFRCNKLEQWMLNPMKMNAEQIDSVWLMIGFEIWATQYLD